MTMDFSEIKPSRKPLPPRMIIYGEPKIGKSKFCSNIPNAIFLDVEGGTGHLDVRRVEREMLSTWADICAVLDGLLVQEHDLQAAIIDTADFMEKVMQLQAATEHAAECRGPESRRRRSSLWAAQFFCLKPCYRGEGCAHWVDAALHLNLRLKT